MKNKKDLMIALTRGIQELYSENYKILLREIKEDINKWEDKSCLWVRTLNIVNMSALPTLIHRFNAISIKG